MFKASNSKRVPLGKTTTLYITISDITGNFSTKFTASDNTLVSLEKVNNQSVRVTGIKEGTVIIYAEVDGRTAQYTLVVGDAMPTTTTTVPNAGESAESDITDTESLEDWEIDLFSSTADDRLAEYIEEAQQTSAGEILLGILGFAMMFGGFGVVLSIIFRNRSPKLNLYPGSRRRFNTGGYRGRTKKRLLPDHYYRNGKKY